MRNQRSSFGGSLYRIVYRNCMSERRAAGEGSLFQTTNGGKSCWCASISIQTEGGRRRFIRGYGATPAEAVSRRTRNLRKRLDGRAATRKPSSPTVREAVAEWIEVKKTTAEPSTVGKYMRDFDRHIVCYIGALHLNELNAKNLRELFYETLKGTGDAQRFHTHKNLNTFLNWCVSEGLISSNPLLQVKRPSYKPAVAEFDAKYIDRRSSYATRMLKKMEDPKHYYHEFYPLFLFMMLGLREAEILGFKWDQVNRLTTANKATIVVKSQLTRRETWEEETGAYIKPRTKNGKDRIIYLPEKWRKALIEQKRKKREPAEEWEEGLVFLQENGKHYSPSYFRKLWREVLTDYITGGKRELTTEEYFRPHAARHIAASFMLNEGVPIETVQDLLGHSSAAMALHYAHQMKETRIAASQAIEKRLK